MSIGAIRCFCGVGDAQPWFGFTPCAGRRHLGGGCGFGSVGTDGHDMDQEQGAELVVWGSVGLGWFQ